MNYKSVSKQIIESVGGSENIKNVFHCMTRLRITLENTELVDEEKLNALPEAKGFVYNGSTIQIIIGPSIVDDLTKVVQAELGLVADSNSEDGEKRSFITIVQSIAMPQVSVIAGVALFSALYSILKMLGISTEEPIMMFMDTMTGMVATAVAIFFGFNAAKTFGGNPYLGGFLAIFVTFGALDGIEIAGITLASGMGGVISTVALGILSAFVERGFKKVIPEVIRYVFVPFFTLMVSLIAFIFVIAPVANLINLGLATFMTFALESGTLVYAIACALLAGFWLLVVMSGLHMAVIMIMFPVAMETGIVPFEPALAMAMASLFGVSTGVFLLNRNKSENVKQLGIASIPLIALGISEPALYGLVLPNPRLFINLGIAAAIGGFINTFIGTQVTYPYAMGVFETFTTTKPALFAMSYVITFVIGLVLTLILNKNNLKYN